MPADRRQYEWSIPRAGIFKLNKFAMLLDSWLPVKNIEELKISTIVCATNLSRGTQVGWRKGEIVPRVLASCSVPVIFNPIKIEGEYYVDGGVLHNLPVTLLLNIEITFIINKFCQRTIFISTIFIMNFYISF